MNELNISCGVNDFKRFIIKYNFRWFKRGIASGCLNQGCVQYRSSDRVFLGKYGYSKYTYYLVRDYTRLSIGEPIWCPFSKKEIDYCLNEINRVLDKKIKWKLREAQIEEIDTWILKVKIPNCYNNLQHLYVLTRIRCLYEAPFSLFFMDALKLQSESKFKGGIEEAYTRVINCLPKVGTSGYFLGSFGETPFNVERSVHRSKKAKFTTLEDLKESFSNLGNKKSNRSIHSIYHEDFNLKIKPIEIHNNEIFDLDWWLNGYRKYRWPYYAGISLTGEEPAYIRKTIKLGNDHEKLSKWKSVIFNI